MRVELASRKSQVERQFERLVFSSRWLMGPFYVGLIVTLAILLYRFALDLLDAVMTLPQLNDKDVVLLALKLIDLSLIANLLLIVTFAGYENFVSRLDSIAAEDRADWMGKVDFSALKVKLIGTIVAISSIFLLSLMLNIKDADRDNLYWALVIQGVLVGSAIALAVMDRVTSGRGH